MLNNANDKHKSDSADNVDHVITQKLSDLPIEIAPDRDLWTGIERAISHKKQQPDHDKTENHFVPMAWAASVLVAVLVAWLSFAPLILSPTQNELVQQQPSSDALVDYMDKSFTQQKKTMLVSFGQPNLTQLPQAMQDELTKLANARKSITKALINDKNNVDLLNLLDFTQQQELKLLEQLYRQYQVI
jgi:hypothetical protein